MMSILREVADIDPYDYECKGCFLDKHNYVEMKMVYEYFNDRYEKLTDTVHDVITTYHTILHIGETESKLLLWMKKSNILIRMYDMAEEINNRKRCYGKKVFDLVKSTIQIR